MKKEWQENISTASNYSEGLITRLRADLKSGLSEREDICVVAVGSLARREASAESDLDYFIVSKNDLEEKDGGDLCKKVRELAEAAGIRPPSAGGAFAAHVTVESIVKNIGGADDSNELLTRRMLFLLESEWLHNEKLYESVLDEAIKRYIRDSITQHQICRFLLNDLIRYYRTICVDFEHKTGSGGKSWGDRNIKLMYSRKLLYFSGILAVAQTNQHTAEEKRKILGFLLRLTPIERIKEVCGNASDGTLRRYNYFLGEMSRPDVRKMLQGTTDDRKEHSEEFRKFKNEGHHFSDDLELLLRTQYPPSHSIHQALMF